MKGRRVQPDQYGWFGDKLEPGDYVRVAPTHMQDGTPLPADWPWAKDYPMYLVCSPNGHVGNLGIHKITEHEDGTITAHPSIVIRRPSDGPVAAKWEDIQWVELWHGFLERGVWRTA